MKKAISVVLCFVLSVGVMFIPVNVSADTEGDFEYSVEGGSAVITKYNGSGTFSAPIDATIPSQLGGYPVASIGDYAFSQCDYIRNVIIPDSIGSIGEKAFAELDCYTGFTVDEGNADFCSVDGVLFNKNKTVLICYPARKTVSPDTYEFVSEYSIPESVVTIGAYSFSESKLSRVYVPDSAEAIGDYAFSKSNISYITIPAGLKTIGKAPFEQCLMLSSSSIAVDAGNQYFNNIDGVLYGVEKKELIVYPRLRMGKALTVPEGVEVISAGAFTEPLVLETVVLPGSIKTIESDAFYHCHIRFIIPESISSFGGNSFPNCHGLEFYFMDDAPGEFELTDNLFFDTVKLYFLNGKSGWSTPEWKGLPTKELYAGDLDRDGDIKVIDALAVLRIAAGLVTQEDFSFRLAQSMFGRVPVITDALTVLRIAAGLV